MNERQKEILHILLTESDGYWHVQDLAEKAACSEKTIRSDLKVIENELRDKVDAALIRKPGLGVILEIDKEDKARLFRELHLTDAASTDEARVIQIAYKLLMAVKSVTAQELASHYFVNRATIKKDLDKIEKWLKRYDLSLVTRKRVGLSIDGNEKKKRAALSRLWELIDNPELTGQFMKKQFSLHEVEFVKRELKALEKRHSLSFADETFEGLIMHTLFIVKRTKLKQPISISEKEKTLLKGKKESAWASEFLKKLERVFAVHFPEDEAIYLALHLSGGKFRDGTWAAEENSPVLSRLLDDLISRMSELNGVDFTKDKALAEGLKIHLYTVLNRLNYGLSVTNPMLGDIKKMYPYMFNKIIHVLEEIDQSFALVIPEEEAGYLTLHFQAALERLHTDKGKVKNAVIVCHMGIGMSQLLLTKIERKFHLVNVIGCIAKAELKGFLSEHDVDLVISTVSLPELQVPHIVVSPLLEATEEKKLGHFIQQLNEPNREKAKELTILKHTTPFLVFLQQDVEHRYKLIEKLANALYDKGYVEKEYAHHAILRERMSATTIGAGIAIPHGNPKLIKQSAIAIATLKKPIEWGGEKVALVFMLAVKNDEQEETRELFRELSSISEQPALIQTLLRETDTMKFLSYFKS